jgi:ATP-dependent RNA helicase DDX56/DBP9
VALSCTAAGVTSADDVHARDRTAAAAAAAAAAAEADVGRGRGRKRKQQEKQAKQQQKARKDEEFGVTRGIDFKGVCSIINFDIPDSVQVRWLDVLGF